MAKPNILNSGDRVAYAAKFLRNIAAYSGSLPTRRGTFVSYWRTTVNGNEKYARVRWDDFDFGAAAAQYGEDYAEDAKANGQLVLAINIAKVGSPRFALNDM